MLVALAQSTAKGWGLQSYANTSLIECPTEDLGPVTTTHASVFDDLLLSSERVL